MHYVREATYKDIDHIYSVTQRAFQEYNRQFAHVTVPAIKETVRDIERELDSKAIFLAWADGAPAGSIRLEQRTAGHFYFSRLGVLPEYRKSGLGARLVRTVERTAFLHGGWIMGLETAYDIKKLLTFYNQLGYRVARIREDADYTRALMEKELSPLSVEVA